MLRVNYILRRIFGTKRDWNGVEKTTYSSLNRTPNKRGKLNIEDSSKLSMREARSAFRFVARKPRESRSL